MNFLKVLFAPVKTVDSVMFLFTNTLVSLREVQAQHEAAQVAHQAKADDFAQKAQAAADEAAKAAALVTSFQTLLDTSKTA